MVVGRLWNPAPVFVINLVCYRNKPAFLVPSRGERHVVQAEHTLRLLANEGGVQVRVHGADLLLPSGPSWSGYIS